MQVRSINRLFSVAILGFGLADKVYGTAYMKIYSGVLSFGQIALVIAIEDALAMIFEYPSGYFSDKIGRKKTTAIGLLILAMGYFCFLSSKTLWWLVIAAGLKALGIALYSGSPQAWYFDELEKIGQTKQRERWIPRLSGWLYALSLMVLLVCAGLSAKLALWIAGIVLVLVGFILLVWGEDNQGSGASGFKQASLRLFKTHSFWRLSVFEMLANVPFVCFILVWQLILIKSFHVEQLVSLVMMAIMGLFSLVSFLNGWFIRKWTEKQLISACLFGLLLTSFILGWSHGSLWIYLVSLFGFEASLCSLNLVKDIWIQKVIEPELRASFYSGINAQKALVSAVLMSLLGLFGQQFGLFPIFLLAALSSFLTLVYFRYVYC